MRHGAGNISPQAERPASSHVTSAALNVLFSTREAPAGSSLKRVAADVAAAVAETAVVPDDLLKQAAVAVPAHELPPELESDGANTEHKLHLVVHASDRLAGLTTQMRWRLREGLGSAVYHLGVTDDGQPVGLPLPQLAASLQTLRRMAVGADAVVVQTIIRRGWHKPAPAAAGSFAAGTSGDGTAYMAGKDGSEGLMRAHDDVREGWYTAEIHLVQMSRALPIPAASAVAAPGGSPAQSTTLSTSSPARDGSASAASAHASSPYAGVPELRLAVVGHGAAGKSTYISCVTSGCLDDGRGLARGKTARHPHEIFQGRTSSVGRHLIGFDASGELVCAGSDKVIGVSLASQTRLVRAAPAFTAAAAAASSTGLAASGAPSTSSPSPATPMHSAASGASPAPSLVESTAGAPDVLATGIGADAIAAASSRLVTLLDLAGDERCARTMLSGLLGSLPDALQIMLDARALSPTPACTSSAASASEGIAPAVTPAPCRLPAATQQHIALAVSLGLPFFFVITHADCTPQAQLDAAVAALGGCTARLAASYAAAVALAAGSAESGRLSRAASPLSFDGGSDGVASASAAAAAIQLVSDDDAAASAAARCSAVIEPFGPAGLESLAAPLSSAAGHERRALLLPPPAQLPAPLFVISSVTGRGFRPLLRFIAALRARRDWAAAAARGKPCFAVQEVLSVEGCTVVAGLVTGGCVRVGDVLWLGPLAPFTLASSHASTASAALTDSSPLLDGNANTGDLFEPVRVACVHVKRAPVSQAAAGQLCTLQLLTVGTSASAAGDAGAPSASSAASVASGLRRSSSDDFNVDPAILRRGQVLLAQRPPAASAVATSASTMGSASAADVRDSDSVSVGTELTVRVAAFYQPPSLLRIPPLLARAQRDVVIFAGAVRQAGRVVAVKRLGIANLSSTQTAPSATVAPAAVPTAATNGHAADGAGEGAGGAAVPMPAPAPVPAPTAVSWPSSTASAGDGESCAATSSGVTAATAATPSTATATATATTGSIASGSSGSSGSGAPLSRSASGGQGCGAAVLQLTVRLLNNAEYLPPGTLAVVRDGQALAAGCVVSCQHSTAASASASAGARRAAAPSRRRGAPAGISSAAAAARAVAPSGPLNSSAAPSAASPAPLTGSAAASGAAASDAISGSGEGAGAGAGAGMAGLHDGAHHLAVLPSSAAGAAHAVALLASAAEEPWRSTSAPAAANSRRTRAGTSASASPRGALPAATTAAAPASSSASASGRARLHAPSSPAGPLVASRRLGAGGTGGGKPARRATGGELSDLAPLSPELAARPGPVAGPGTGPGSGFSMLGGTGSRSSPLAGSATRMLPPVASTSASLAQPAKPQRGSQGSSSLRKPRLRDREPTEESDDDSDDGGGLLAALAAAGGAGF